MVRSNLLEATLILPATNRLLDGGHGDLNGLGVDIDMVPCSTDGRVITGAGHVAMTGDDSSNLVMHNVITVCIQMARAKVQENSESHVQHS